MASTNKIVLGLMSARDYAEVQGVIHDWIREDVPLAAKMNLTPQHVAKLVERLTGSRTHFPKSDKS